MTTLGTVQAEVLLKSINAETGQSITTYLVTYPRIILAEVNTHKLLSRNTASSRAVPLKTMRKRVTNELYLPKWTVYKKGMSSNELVTGWRKQAANYICLSLFKVTSFAHYLLERLEVSKQDANRYLEPWMYIQQVITVTDDKNLFKLRVSPDAQPVFQELAHRMMEANENAPYTLLEKGEWHIPFVTEDERSKLPLLYLLRISAARCARVSYFVGTPSERLLEDIKLANKLMMYGHMSPCEHQAMCSGNENVMMANFTNFIQFRKFIEGESGGDVNAAKILTRNEMYEYFGHLDPFTEF